MQKKLLILFDILTTIDIHLQCAVSLHAGLSTGYERARNGGIIWQMLGDFKPDRKAHSYVLAVGGRYDGMLADFQ